MHMPICIINPSREMETPELAAKIKQRVAVRLEPGVIDMPHENQMVAAVMNGMGAAIERRQRSGKDR